VRQTKTALRVKHRQRTTDVVSLANDHLHERRSILAVEAATGTGIELRISVYADLRIVKQIVFPPARGHSPTGVVSRACA